MFFMEKLEKYVPDVQAYLKLWDSVCVMTNLLVNCHENIVLDKRDYQVKYFFS